MSDPFDIVIDVRGHDLRLIGNSTRYRPAKGPTMENSGGEPDEGGEVEITAAFLIRLPHRTLRVRKYHERKLCPDAVDALASDTDVDDEVREELARIIKEGGFRE